MRVNMGEVKLCECGCGTPTPIAKRTCGAEGQRRGSPVRFAPYHSYRLRSSPLLNPAGYVVERKERIHRRIVEKAMGKLLRPTAPVHHVNFDRGDNRNGNLVACNDTAYHGLLHRRSRALDACGHASWERCKYCKEYDEPSAMYAAPGQPNNFYHRACRRLFEKGYKRQGRSPNETRGSFSHD